MFEIIREILGLPGKMVSYSKSTYNREYPTHVVVFNANVCTEEDGKIWYGDVDVTLDEFRLKRLAKVLKKKIYVLKEMDGRFENESKPKLDRAVYWADEEGFSYFSENAELCG